MASAISRYNAACHTIAARGADAFENGLNCMDRVIAGRLRSLNGDIWVRECNNVVRISHQRQP
ncbi:MAG: hypothetical protein QOJ41_1182 [Acidobacteriaceae bacterium]|nr:hypothetical protein [Acidobacteriaceae bacterium]